MFGGSGRVSRHTPFTRPGGDMSAVPPNQSQRRGNTRSSEVIYQQCLSGRALTGTIGDGAEAAARGFALARTRRLVAEAFLPFRLPLCVRGGGLIRGHAPVA
jgi:hypothetical protein